MKTIQPACIQMNKTRLLFSFLFVLVAACVFCQAANSQAYEYPIGIPNAWIDPDIPRPARPNPWTSEQAGYYYINYQTGSDSRTYGTPSAPRATIPNPVPAGAYLEIHGKYNYKTAGDLEIYPHGTSSHPIWLVGIKGDEPLFQDAKLFVSGSYLYIDNIKVKVNGPWTGIQFGSNSQGYPADHMMIRNSEIYGQSGTLQYGISASGSSSDHVSYILAYHNTVHDINWSAPGDSDDDADAVNMMEYCSYAWTLDNHIFNIGGAGGAVGGAIMGSSVYTNSHHLYYGRNHVHDTWAVGFAGKWNNHTVFSENNIHDILDTPWSPAKCLGMQYEPQDTWFIYNTLHDARYGIRVPSTYAGHNWNIYIIGNLIYNINREGTGEPNDTYAEAGISIIGCAYRYIINNTIYNSYAGINATGSSGNWVIENNIISHVTEGNHIWVYNTSGATVRNNLTYEPGGKEKIKWGNTVYNLSEFQNATDQGSGSSAANPLFVSETDFHLQSSSPAKDTALADTALTTNVYALFQSIYGKDIRVDRANIPRPQGRTFDIGAYEYDEGYEPPPSGSLNPPADFTLIQQ